MKKVFTILAIVLMSTSLYADFVPATEASAVTNVSTDIPVHVYGESIEAYKITAPWNRFTNVDMIIGTKFEVDSIHYQYIGEKKVEVISKLEKYVGNVEIPAEVVFDGVTYHVTTIADSAFDDCVGITAVTIPSSVTSVGDYAFRGCSNLSSITISDGVTSIGNSAFYSCSGLDSIILPASVTTIGKNAFQGCVGIASITIPEDVTSVGNYAFSLCSSLTSVIWNATHCTSVGTADAAAFYTIASKITSFRFGDGVIHIPAYLCYGMSNLESVTLLDGVTSIGSNAFQTCSGLDSITIPASVTAIGNEAFRMCTNLVKITSLNTTPPTVDGLLAFLGVTKTIPLYVPQGSAELYKEAAQWKEFYIQEISETQGTPTEVETPSMTSPHAVRKVFEKGAIYIIHQGEKYTIDGRRVN